MLFLRDTKDDKKERLKTPFTKDSETFFYADLEELNKVLQDT